MELNVNGVTYATARPPLTSLLSVLREELQCSPLRIESRPPGRVARRRHRGLRRQLTQGLKAPNCPTRCGHIKHQWTAAECDPTGCEPRIHSRHRHHFGADTRRGVWPGIRCLARV